MTTTQHDEMAQYLAIAEADAAEAEDVYFLAVATAKRDPSMDAHEDMLLALAIWTDARAEVRALREAMGFPPAPRVRDLYPRP